ncbi:MAG: hypothetical protein V7L27_07000 [Nostoc sp.]|uniref:hypothetical protein n=1 Tax=Nostoc sp. TaxID=1180 RepID=UPI002FFD4E73
MTNDNGKHFIRHNLCLWIMYKKKKSDVPNDITIKRLQDEIDRLPTIRSSGCRFRYETIRFSEDDAEVDSLLLPLAMFEDLMKDKYGYGVQNTNALEEIKKGEYKSKPNDSERIKLFAWLQSNSLSSLLQTNNNK